MLFFIITNINVYISSFFPLLNTKIFTKYIIAMDKRRRVSEGYNKGVDTLFGKNTATASRSEKPNRIWKILTDEETGILHYLNPFNRKPITEPVFRKPMTINVQPKEEKRMSIVDPVTGNITTFPKEGQVDVYGGIQTRSKQEAQEEWRNSRLGIKNEPRRKSLKEWEMMLDRAGEFE